MLQSRLNLNCIDVFSAVFKGLDLQIAAQTLRLLFDRQIFVCAHIVPKQYGKTVNDGYDILLFLHIGHIADGVERIVQKMRIDLVLQNLKFQLVARLLRALNVVQKIPDAVNHADDLILKRFNLVAGVNHGLHLQILSADLCYSSAQLLDFCGFTEQKDCQECDCYHAEQQADCHRCQADAAKFTRYIAFGHNTERQPAGQLGTLIDHKTGNTVDFRIAAAACFALPAACQQLCSDLLRHVQRVDNAFAYRVNDINCAKTVEVLAIAVV